MTRKEILENLRPLSRHIVEVCEMLEKEPIIGEPHIVDMEDMLSSMEMTALKVLSELDRTVSLV